MSIRPIDYQILVPKTQQTAQENQHQQNRLRIEQQHLVQLDQKEVERHLNKVNASEHKDEARIKNPKEKNNKKNDRDSKRKNQQEKSEDHKNDKEIVMEGIGSNIDIKI